jgi:hypothetical protein
MNNSRTIAGSRSLLTKSLLVIQVAVSLVLLVGAGLFARSLANMQNMDIGFNTKNLIVFSVDPFTNKYSPNGQSISRSNERTHWRCSGVKSVTNSRFILLSGSASNGRAIPEDDVSRLGARNSVYRKRSVQIS